MSRQMSLLCTLVCIGASALTTACGDAPATPPAKSPAIPGGSDSGGAAGSNAMGGSAGLDASAGSQQTGKALTWDAQGFVAPDANPFAIQGPFYAYSDCDPPSGLPCTMPDAALTGADGKPGWSVDATHVCMKGTAVKVQNNMFAAQWGAGLALDLNSKGGEPGMPAVKGTFDLNAAKIRGLSVDISGTAPGRIRINLTMPGVADSNFVDATVPGTTTFQVADAKQGSWVMSKTPLDPSKVEALQFQVFTTAAMPTPYNFCVDAIRVISDAEQP
jgi:hypothetical protein